jgi:P27 family predicted phage terminase small subunit
VSKPDIPAARRTWTKPARTFYRSVVDRWELAGEDFDLLRATVERLDQYWRAQAILDKEGLTFVTDTQIRKHPCIEIQKAAWAGFLAGLKALGLEEAADRKKPGRPIGSGLSD